MNNILNLKNINIGGLSQELREKYDDGFKLETALAYVLHAFPNAGKMGEVTVEKTINNDGYTENYELKGKSGNKRICVGYDRRDEKITVEIEDIIHEDHTDTKDDIEANYKCSVYQIEKNPRNKKGTYVVRSNYSGSYRTAYIIEETGEWEMPGSYNGVRRKADDFYRVSSDFSLTTGNLNEMVFDSKELYYDKYNPQLTPEIASGYMRMITPEYAKELSAAFNRGENLTKIPNGYVVTPPDNQTQLTIVYELDENYKEQIRITREERVFPDFKDTYDKDGFRVTRYILTLKDEAIAKIDKKDNKPTLKVARTVSANGKELESENIYYKIGKDYQLLTYLWGPLEIMETEKRNVK